MYINNNNNLISLLSFNQYKLFQKGVMRSKFDIYVFIYGYSWYPICFLYNIFQ